MDDSDILPRYKKFAEKYLETGKISASARFAGYAESSAHVSGNRLLKKPEVQQYLAQRGNELTAQQEELSAKVIRELDTMAFANIADFITIDKDGKPHVDFSTATPEQLRAIASIKSKVSKRYDKDGKHIATEEESAFVMADKYRGLELLGKHLGLFKAEEQRVVVDVADRLVAARMRVARISKGGGGRGGV
jgi:phage terminase small subunit